VPTLRDAEPEGNTSDVAVHQHLLIGSAGGDSLPDVRLRDVPLPEVPVPKVPLPDAFPGGSVGEE